MAVRTGNGRETAGEGRGGKMDIDEGDRTMPESSFVGDLTKVKCGATPSKTRGCNVIYWSCQSGVLMNGAEEKNARLV